MPLRNGAHAIPCPVCSADSFAFTTVQNHRILRCPSCGHGFLHPPPSPQQLAQAYNTAESNQANSNAFALLDAYLKNPETIHRHNSRLRTQITKLIPAATPDPAILEAGCSTGVLLKSLIDNGYNNVQGVEINSAAAAAGQQRLGVTIHNTAIEEFETENRFDLIIAYAIIEHAINPVAMLQKIARLLKTGGAVYIVVPNFNGTLRLLLGNKWLWYMPPYHIHHFTTKSMRLTIEAADLSNIRIRTENTATNAYLLHYVIFGSEKTENVKPANPNLYKAAAAYDAITEAIFSPILRPMRAAGLGAHIAASANATGSLS